MTSDLRNDLGRAIRSLRVEMGWSQEDLAAAAGLHRTYISQVERGARNVSLATIELLATALGLAPSEIFGPKLGGSDR